MINYKSPMHFSYLNFTKIQRYSKHCFLLKWKNNIMYLKRKKDTNINWKRFLSILRFNIFKSIKISNPCTVYDVKYQTITSPYNSLKENFNH